MKICDDCRYVLIEGTTPPDTDLERDLEILQGIIDTGWLILIDKEYEEFETTPCECCGYPLAGPRFYAERENHETQSPKI